MTHKGKILITGGTGFIGRKLVALLLEQGYQVTVLTRRPLEHAAEAQSGALEFIDNLNSLDLQADWYGVINLAGEPLNSARWNKSTKAHMLESRAGITRSINRWMRNLAASPRVYLSASAIGWYGHWQDEVLSEDSAFHPCFSHELCAAWEAAATTDLPDSCRVCVMRLGIVLGKDGGPFPQTLLPAKFGASTMGSGKQWWSWIHVSDATHLFLAALENDQYEGVINLTAPEPVTQKQFSRVLARQLKRPAIFPAPGCALRLVLGEFADEILLKGQRVLPRKAEAAGYQFQFPTLDSAISNLLT